MANIRKANLVECFSQSRSLAVIAILGLAVTLAATREAKTATIANTTTVITIAKPVAVASPAPLIEQPKIELMHDAVPAAAVVTPVVKTVLIPTIPTIAKPAHRTLKMQVTAYCACPKCCGPDAIGLTASGKDVSYNNGRFVASDKQFAFGTNLVIPGYNDSKPVEVQDRGGAIKGNKLDVFFPTHQEALEWGRRNIEVTVID